MLESIATYKEEEEKIGQEELKEIIRNAELQHRRSIEAYVESKKAYRKKIRMLHGTIHNKQRIELERSICELDRLIIEESKMHRRLMQGISQCVCKDQNIVKEYKSGFSGLFLVLFLLLVVGGTNCK